MKGGSVGKWYVVGEEPVEEGNAGGRWYQGACFAAHWEWSTGCGRTRTSASVIFGGLGGTSASESLVMGEPAINVVGDFTL